MEPESRDREIGRTGKRVKIAVAGLFVLALLCAMVYRFIESRKPGPYTILLAMRPMDIAIKDVFEGIEREFNSTHDDVKFKVVWGDTLGKLPLLVAAHKMPDLWEVANFTANQKEKQKLLIDLEPYLQRDWEEIDGDDFFPELIEGCRSGGRLNLMPRWYNLPVLTYRPSHFKEAGIAPPDESWTWEDYFEAGRKLVRRDKNGRVTRWGSSITYGWWEEWLTYVRQAGGRLFDEKGERVVLDTPEAILGLKNWALKVREGWCPDPDELVGTRFEGGGFSMSVCVPTIVWRKLRRLGDTDWDIAPLPKGPRGRITGEMAIAGIGITRDCKRPDEAWEVLKMLTGRHAVMEYCRRGVVPARKSAAREVFLAGKP